MRIVNLPVSKFHILYVQPNFCAKRVSCFSSSLELISWLCPCPFQGTYQRLLLLV